MSLIDGHLIGPQAKSLIDRCRALAARVEELEAALRDARRFLPKIDGTAYDDEAAAVRNIDRVLGGES